MEKAVSGHGVFIYDARQTIAHYGSADAVAAAAAECDMQHAWVRIHGATQTHAEEPTLSLITALRNQNIHVAGWGWCQGAQISAETELALVSLRQFGLEHYIADIEQGVNNANWTVNEVREFLGGVREVLPDLTIGVSSFGFLPFHEPRLMQAAEEFVDFFAPQVYWFWFPNTRLLQAVGATPEQYTLNSAVSYTRLCIDTWRDSVSKPLVITGQAYWGEHPEYTQDLAERKLQNFVNNFEGWEQIQGLNWWHMGGRGQSAMSFNMFQAIKEARLNGKFNPLPPDPLAASARPVTGNRFLGDTLL